MNNEWQHLMYLNWQHLMYFLGGGGHGQFYDGGGADVYHPVHADEGHEQPGDDARGCHFFEKRGRNIRLTSYGEPFYEDLKKISQDLSGSIHKLHDMIDLKEREHFHLRFLYHVRGVPAP